MLPSAPALAETAEAAPGEHSHTCPRDSAPIGDACLYVYHEADSLETITSLTTGDQGPYRGSTLG